MMAAKVAGTIHLKKATSTMDLDFFIVCSSLNSFLGSTGQVAYCSANAFLNAYAFMEEQNGDVGLSAIAWDSWKEVGMAARLTGTKQSPRAPQLPLRSEIQHYLFDWVADQEDGSKIYFKSLDPDRHWLIDEHRIMNFPTMPATGFLEILRSALSHLTGETRMELFDVYFLAPLVHSGDGTSELMVEISKKEKYYELSVKSIHKGDVHTHVAASAVINPTYEENGKAGTLSAIKKRLSELQTIEDDDSKRDNQTLRVGPRWKNLNGIQSAGDHGLAQINLPPRFSEDLRDYKLHPALLDTATSFMIGNFTGKGMFVPFSYKKITIYQDLTADFHSVARQKNSPERTGQSLEFDITLLSENGDQLVDIEGFTLVSVKAQPKEPGTKPPAVVLDHGITNKEGIDVFRRVLPARLPVVAISTRNIQAIQQKEEQARTAGSETETSVSGSRHQRPELSVAYTAPRTETETRLSEIWANFLGLEKVGIHDDFFELGVDSLQVITISSRIHREMDIKIPVSEFFNRTNVKGLAEFVADAAMDAAGHITHVEARESYPLSSAQKRLFIHQQLAPQSVAYNLPQVITFGGELDLERWQVAFDKLIQRHEILRTSFSLLDGEPVQTVLRQCRLKIACSDATQAGIGERVVEFIRPFNLGEAPLVRSHILHVDGKYYVWLFDIHHIASDATGIAILQQDLFALYDGEELEPLEIQYRDYAIWQHSLLESGALKVQEDYWNEALEGVEPGRSATLPYDFPRPAVMKYEGKDYAFVMDAELTGNFNKMGAEAGVTLFMNLLAVLYVMLYKYTGRTDMVVGSAIAGRSHADLEKLVGMFVNLLPIRFRLSPESSYLDVLEQIKEISLQAFANQDVQFESLVEALEIPVESYRNPLFDVCLNVQTYQQTQLDVDNINISEEGAREKGQASKFDLTLWANPVRERLIFNLEYSTELYKRETMEHFSRRLLDVIALVSERPDIEIQEIEIFTGIYDQQLTMPDDDADFDF
jgi:acyl carrier protein